MAEHLVKGASLRRHSPLMTYAPLLSRRRASYGIWPGKCQSYSYPQKSKWWEAPYLSDRGSLYRHRVRALDWETSRRSRWPTDRSSPGQTTPTWSWHPTKACARQASQSTGGGRCARAGTRHFWVHSGDSTASAPPAVGSGRQTGQCDCCQRSWGVKVGGSCARKGLCGQRCRSPLVQRKVQQGHLSCSTLSCWSLPSTEARGSSGCHPRFPLVRCPDHCSSQRSRECIGRLFFCYRAKTQTSVFYLQVFPNQLTTYVRLKILFTFVSRDQRGCLRLVDLEIVFLLHLDNNEAPCSFYITTHSFVNSWSSLPDGQKNRARLHLSLVSI